VRALRAGIRPPADGRRQLKFTNRELEKCAAREAAMRKNVFAKRGIGPKEEREIAMMEAIAAHFKKLADEEAEDASNPRESRQGDQKV
jgi:hypothetical protein